MQAQNIQFKYERNEAEVMRLELGGGDVLVVRGDPNNGGYDWVLTMDGHTVSNSNGGYGWAAVAMRDGLAFYTGASEK